MDFDTTNIPTNIQFVNKSNNTISINWLDEETQKEVHYCQLTTDSEYIQPTFLRQQWVIRNVTDNKLTGSLASCDTNGGISLDSKIVSFTVDVANSSHVITEDGTYLTKQIETKVDSNDASLTGQTPAYQYEQTDIAGFVVHYEEGVFEYNPSLREHLTKDLIECRKIINLSTTAQKLMFIPHIYVNKDYKYNGKSADRACCSHWSAEWLRLNGNLAEKEGSVEIYCAHRYVLWCRDQPAMLFHELCHSYHWYIRSCADESKDFIGPLQSCDTNEGISLVDQCRMKDKLITDTYNKACDSGKYKSVQCISGVMIKHYGLTNALEYFAECCEAFFSSARFRNDFYPFIFEEFKEFDREGFDMVATVWDVQKLMKNDGKVFERSCPADYDPKTKKYIPP